ncbi:SpoIIE family protein phosphatase [Nocardia sp. NPDC005978]|uniref:SpoIIE family protein phosphatase n=1 Tax=Nocardia sp. NPDC005978 TaxID=3156725 RepID=UPI0033B63A14
MRSGESDGPGRSTPEPWGGIFGADQEIGRDLSRVDWDATPLGPVSEWPVSLQTAVNILLSSRFSMWMGWGPQLTFFCNAAYRRDSLGRKYPWALGRPASEVWAEIWDDIESRTATVLSTGEATWDEALLLFVERSGYTEESYHTFSYSPLRDDAGAVVGMLCVVSEETERVISERRMASLRDLGSDPSVIQTEEQVLRFAEKQFANNPFDFPFTASYMFDSSGAATLAGTSGVQAGHALAPLTLGPADQAVWPIGELRQGNSVLVDLADAASADLPRGAWPQPPAQALAVPLGRQGGEPYGFLVTGLNRFRALDDDHRGFISLVAGHLAAGIASARSFQAQQRRAEELAELDRVKTLFFSNISHEFRTPLTLIMGPVAELRRRGDLGDDALEALELVHRNGLRLNKLVASLLDFSRLEAGRMQARYAPADLATITTDFASVFESAMARAGLEFVVDCTPLDEPVYLDAGMWEKIIFNLLSNALKFTFAGSVRVGVERAASHAKVTVSDTGVGVPAHEMPRLFERFHRIATTRARSHEGSGIGLALVRELVELHGGTISASSREEAGTTFTVLLPFGSAHLPSQALAATATATDAVVAEQYLQEALRWLPSDGASPGSKPDVTADVAAAVGGAGRVIVADDNADMREYLVRLLSGAGYDVQAVGDGLHALRAVRAEVPQLLVSDIMMPGLGGLELVRALRAESRTAAVPVLLLSARAGQEAAIEGLEVGADDYLVKPFAAAELLARVRAIVDLNRLRNHHARWRAALVDSLHEAFFICDEDGVIIEINNAFSEIVGVRPESLPLHPARHVAPGDQPDDTPLPIADALALARAGQHVLPVLHRDAHVVWIAATANPVQDPDTGQRVFVGTFRDVSAEHYQEQYQTALAAVNSQLAQSDSIAEALAGVVVELRDIWHARRVLALVFPEPTGLVVPAMTVSAASEPTIVAAGEAVSWADLAAPVRDVITAVRDGEPLTAVIHQATCVGIAMRHPDGVLVLWIEMSEQRSLSVVDRTSLAILGGRLGQGLARAHQLQLQRETALALQHAMLGPSQLPPDFAVRYQPATRPLQVGGDWYDVVDLDDGRIALVVGDCVGHGLAAATVMGQLRSACRALLLEHPQPARTLTALDRFAARLPGAKCTTVFCGVLDPDTGELVYASAGHPPPILMHADGVTTHLRQARSLPLGVRPEHSRSEAGIRLTARSTLLLYTDGLVERRRHSLSEGIEAAGVLVRAGSDQTPEELATAVLAGMTPDDGYEDDVALLLFRQPAPLRLEFPAQGDNLADVRATLRDWLGRCGLEEEQAFNVLFSASEAVSNAIEHGHRELPDGLIRVSATALVDQVRLTITDTGVWRPPLASDRPYRGRGLDMMRSLMHDVQVCPGDSGTTVHLQARIQS